MRERNLYRGTSDFQGSIDEDGRIYDERHRLVGRIEGNVVYDSCNIKQGTIDENGKLWDVNHTYVGQARGSNFIGPSYQSIARLSTFETKARVLRGLSYAFLNYQIKVFTTPLRMPFAPLPS